MNEENLFIYIKNNILKKDGTINQVALRWGKLKNIEKELNLYIPGNLDLQEKLHLFYHQIDRPKCKTCGGNVKFYSFSKGYSSFCSNSCAQKNKEIIDKKKKTSLKRYGTEHPNRLKEVKDKIKKTNLIKYGFDSHNSSQEIKNKKKNTYIKKYGVDNPLKIEAIKNKVKNTNLERYGNENPYSFGSDNYQKVIKEKYNVDNVSQLESVKKKKKKKQLIKTYENLKKDYEYDIQCSLEEFEGVMTPYYWKCKFCGRVFFSYITYRRCPKCNPIQKPTSNKEKELIDFIQSNYSGEIQLNTKKIITPMELDVYIPDLNLAVEFNGIYWHSELQGKDKNYHLLKTENCEKVGIKLIQVYEHEWDENKELVKRMLLNRIGLKGKKIRTAKCLIKEIDSKTKNQFLQKYHIQGKDTSSIKLGAYYNDELLGVMTFSKPSRAKGKKYKSLEFELSRFSVNYDYSVYGLAGKMLKYFKMNYDWNEIYTYADRRWSQGNMYEKLGFTFDKDTPPNYWYIVDKKIYHRFVFRKSELPKFLKEYDEELTEWENMKLGGFDRIWDCGNKKYTLSRNMSKTSRS